MTKKIKNPFLIFILVAAMIMTFIPKVEIVYAATVNLNPSFDSFFDNLQYPEGLGNGDEGNIASRVVNCVGNMPSTFENAKSQMQFDLSSVSGTVSSAQLKLYVAYVDATPTAPLAKLYGSNDDGWNEATSTLISQDTFIQQNSVSASDGWVTFDVTNFINNQVSGDKVASFVLTGAPYSSEESRIFAYCSDEDSTYKPQLIVNYAAARTGKAIVSTTYGSLSGGNVISVPYGTKVSDFKAGLAVSDGAKDISQQHGHQMKREKPEHLY